MKPLDLNVQWCLEHRDLIALWLERRGGWRRGDWCVPASSYAAVPLKLVTATSGLDPGYAYTNCSIVGEEGKIVWIPTAHDMLEMLGAAVKDRRDSEGWKLRFSPRLGYRATLPDADYPRLEDFVQGDWEKTPLIALMEVLKTLEEATGEAPTG